MIAFVDLGGNGQEEGVFKLREHVTHVEHRVKEEPFAWGDFPGESLVYC